MYEKLEKKNHYIEPSFNYSRNILQKQKEFKSIEKPEDQKKVKIKKKSVGIKKISVYVHNILAIINSGTQSAEDKLNSLRQTSVMEITEFNKVEKIIEKKNTPAEEKIKLIRKYVASINKKKNKISHEVLKNWDPNNVDMGKESESGSIQFNKKYETNSDGKMIDIDSPERLDLNLVDAGTLGQKGVIGQIAALLRHPSARKFFESFQGNAEKITGAGATLAATAKAVGLSTATAFLTVAGTVTFQGSERAMTAAEIEASRIRSGQIVTKLSRDNLTSDFATISQNIADTILSIEMGKEFDDLIGGAVSGPTTGALATKHPFFFPILGDPGGKKPIDPKIVNDFMDKVFKTWQIIDLARNTKKEKKMLANGDYVGFFASKFERYAKDKIMGKAMGIAFRWLAKLKKSFAFAGSSRLGKNVKGKGLKAWFKNTFFSKGNKKFSSGKPTSKTFGKPIEMPYKGNKIKLRIDAEPGGNKVQIQSGGGKKSIIDRRIDINKAIEPQIPKFIKRNLSKGQLQNLIKHIESAVKWLNN